MRWSNLNLLITILVFGLPQGCIQDVFEGKDAPTGNFYSPNPIPKSLNFAVARLLLNGCPVARGAYDLPLGTKISNKEPERTPKTYDSQANFMVNEWQNSLLFALWNENVKQDFRCSAVEVTCLKMASNKFKSLRKTFGVKIMSFSPVLEMLSHYWM